MYMKERFALLSFLFYNQNMRIDILTLFPNMFEPLFESVLGRAVSSKKLEINLVTKSATMFLLAEGQEWL